MHDRPVAVRLVQAIMAVFMGAVYGLMITFGVAKVVSVYEPDLESVTLLVAFPLVWALMAHRMYRVDVQRQYVKSPSNMIGATIMALALIGMLIELATTRPDPSHSGPAGLIGLLLGLVVGVGLAQAHQRAVRSHDPRFSRVA